MTWDQGKELAHHQQITAATGTQVFFCDAHSPWQRASNENMNGLLRDYFPKGTDLSVHSAQELTRVAAEVNERPRKTLAGRGPQTCSTTRSHRHRRARASRRILSSAAPPSRKPPATVAAAHSNDIWGRGQAALTRFPSSLATHSRPRLPTAATAESR